MLWLIGASRKWFDTAKMKITFQECVWDDPGCNMTLSYSVPHVGT